MENTPNLLTHRLAQGVQILDYIAYARKRAGDEGIGRGIEAWVVGRELRELERLAMADAGPSVHRSGE